MGLDTPLAFETPTVVALELNQMLTEVHKAAIQLLSPFSGLLQQGLQDENIINCAMDSAV